MNRILIAGGTGLLGPYLAEAACRMGEVVVSSRRTSPPLDLEDAASVSDFMARHKPDIVVHTAGLTDVDVCERQPEAADRANHVSIRNLAASTPAAARLVYISTDQVYPDDAGPHSETNAAPVNVYECADGRIYGGVLLDSHWRSLCGLMGCDELAHLRNVERVERRDELDALMATWCRQFSTDEVVAKLTDIGLAVTRVNTFAEASAHPHVAARDMLQTMRLADGSEIPLTGPAAKFSRTPTAVREPAPSLGQHNESIYGALGYDAAELARLREAGVI